MKNERFDALTRSMVTTSRRGALRLLTGSALTSLLANLGLNSVAAQEAAGCQPLGKECHKGDKCCGGGRCKGGVCKCTGGTTRCRSRCIPSTKCCVDTDCGTGGATCQNGVCDCPPGQRDCNATCIPNGDCCDPATDCDDGNPCTTDSCSAGTCNHTPDPAGAAYPGGVCDGAGSCVPCNQGENCTTQYPGVCAAGTIDCSSGQPTCVPTIQPGQQVEICDGLDNDCDGVADEGDPGGGQPCDTGLSGVCAAGTTQCVGGQLQCIQNVRPSPEVCDGLDNDCNGQVDDGNPGGGAACNTGTCVGTTACVLGQIVCVC